MYWAVNPDSHRRGVIITLNGADEFMMLVKPKGGRTDVDKDEVVSWVQRSIGEDIPVRVIGYRPWSAGQALVAERYKAGRDRHRRGIQCRQCVDFSATSCEDYRQRHTWWWYRHREPLGRRQAQQALRATSYRREQTWRFG